eukprot:CAMPEP_0172027888 /NCGR_PEP_ID=MMETSP1041-20130122/17249_1 /TAXON_ID=464988 /ORGANISM="Hemiselmis andersenii, Strain CCMP439" /LENGTH=52 /DNA_ID=CAMNT_0012683837 /DNA_START=29 /DNA_END=184 /DNA_ORIENTATION=+
MYKDAKGNVTEKPRSRNVGVAFGEESVRGMTSMLGKLVVEAGTACADKAERE